MQQILLRTNAFTISVMVACLSAGSSAWAQELDKVPFGAAWVAEAAHGGFYQAAGGGTYRKHGLDVTIVQGGLQVDGRQQLSRVSQNRAAVHPRNRPKYKELPL